MAKKKDLYYVEITDIIEPEQEDKVIEVVNSYVKKGYQEMKDYFQQTDTLQVKKLSKEDAEGIVSELEGIEVITKIYSHEDKIKEAQSNKIRCPRCGYVLEYPDWRCPECYYEFPDYEYVDDDDLE
ncbi:MAG: hypothetical protein DRP55_10840 [Spirochaetes bacterium]|nr:MAG: hypothetical protein DRP55_10840 [Spirochaetota bacterium]